MFIANYIIHLHNKGYSNKYIASQIFNYNRHLKNILNKDESLKFVDIIIIDYITTPSL